MSVFAMFRFQPNFYSMKKFLSLFLFVAGFYSFKTTSAAPADSLKLESILKPLVMQDFQQLQVPGAIVGVWMKGYEPFITAVGFSNLENKTPMSVSDKVRIGSITKTFTGLVLLQLVDEGKISLSDPLSKYFPDFPNGKNITIKELADMTSGIYNYTEDLMFSDFSGSMKKNYTHQELIDIALKHPPYFKPGSTFHYSNTNFILLGMIIEKITGDSLPNEIQKRILTPLGMTDTSFPVDTIFANRHAHGYEYADSTSASPKDVTNLNTSAAWAAGAMVSTLNDLYKYAKPLVTGKLISQATHQVQMKMKHVKRAYGIAIADFNGVYGHNGGIPGFNSFMGYMPRQDATIIVLVNMQNTKKGISPADYISQMIGEKLKAISH
jgi:D-alanyl-D-alanine carboxypeptidase